MTLLIGLFPSAFVESKAVTSWRWMAALLYFFFFLLLPSRPNLIALSTREATIMTTEMISKSDMISPPQLSYLEAKSQAPSVSFLPEAQGLHCYYSIAARARQIMFSNVFNFFVPLSEKRAIFARSQNYGENRRFL